MPRTFATFEQTQDIAATNNPVAMTDLAKAYPGMDWPRYFRDAGLPAVDHVVIAHPGAVKGTIEQMRTTPLSVWRDYLRARLLDNSADWLPAALRDAKFEYVGRVLQHRSEPRPRGDLAVSMLQTTVPELVGRVYVNQVANPATKQAALLLVAQLRAAFRARLATLDWMDAATRKEAIAKLDALDVKVGWPDRWTDYGDQSLKADDLVGNMRRIREAVLRARIRELMTGRDTARWRLPVTDVQAAYDPVANELTVAAGILQPPFFDPKADPAANFGAIGGIIGHELSHGFDATGRQTDAQGKARDWWSPASAAAFKQRAAMVVADYAGYPQPDGLKINGTTTLDENIADIGGLSIAYAAYRRAVPSPARIGGLKRRAAFLPQLGADARDETDPRGAEGSTRQRWPRARRCARQRRRAAPGRLVSGVCGRALGKTLPCPLPARAFVVSERLTLSRRSLLGAVAVGTLLPFAARGSSGVRPPVARRDPRKSVLHGRVSIDDYGWMEDDRWPAMLRDGSSLKPEMQAFVDAENAYGKSVLAAVADVQAEIVRDMERRTAGADVPDLVRDGDWLIL